MQGIYKVMREHTRMKSLTNVNTVQKHLLKIQQGKSMRGHTQEKNLTNALFAQEGSQS